MKIDLNAYFTLLAPILALFVGAILNRYFVRKAKLLTYISNVSSFKISKDVDIPYFVYTHSIVIKNTGGKTSNNVKIGHTNLPNFNIYPEIQYNIVNLPHGGKEIIIPSLVPDEQVIINYLYFPPLTWDKVNTHVKSDEGFAKVINVLLTPQYSHTFKYLILIMLIIGLTTVMYFILIFLRLIFNIL